MSTINTSRAKRLSIKLWDIGDIPLSLSYKNNQTNLPIDITNYAFKFRLMVDDATVVEYDIAQGDLTSAFLTKTGTPTNILNTGLMWSDIQEKVKGGKNCRLLQIVTDSEGTQLVHIVYLIYVSRY